jgi:hypothetical protein
MSDPAPTPAPAPKTPKHHGLLDKHQLAEISLANTIYGVANDPAIFPKIQDEPDHNACIYDAVGNDLAGMSQYTGNVAEAKTDSKLDTSSEAAAKKALLDQNPLHPDQGQIEICRQQPHVLPDYGIGTNITISRPALETAADNVVNKLKTDTLPKITAQHGTDLQTALDAYKKTKVAQVAAKATRPTAPSCRRWWKAWPCAAASCSTPPTANFPTTTPPAPA